MSSNPKLPHPILRCAAIVLVLVMANNPAQAAFHQWQIREIFSDSSGTLQFIELFSSTAAQNNVNGQQISVTDGVSTNIFTVPGSSLSGSTSSKALLFGTAGIQAAGAPIPDYTLPNNFLFTGGGTISFFGANSGTYTALPTDAVMSRTWTGGNASNTPENYAGTVGFIVVPEAGTGAVMILGAIGCLVWNRRRLLQS